MLRPYRFLLSSIIASVLAVPMAANAQLINGSFEDGDFTGVNPQGAAGATQLFPGATNMTGWTVITQELAWIGAGNPYNYVAPDGVRSLDLSGYHDFFPFGGVSQSINTQAGATYRLSFMIGAFGGNTSAVTGSADGTSQTLSFTGSPTNGGIQWGTVGFDFVADDATTLISLVGASATQNFNLGLDNVSVTLLQAPPSAAAPEPATCALLATGLLPATGAIFRSRRRR